MSENADKDREIRKLLELIEVAAPSVEPLFLFFNDFA